MEASVVMVVVVIRGGRGRGCGSRGTSAVVMGGGNRSSSTLWFGSSNSSSSSSSDGIQNPNQTVLSVPAAHRLRLVLQRAGCQKVLPAGRVIHPKP